MQEQIERQATTVEERRRRRHEARTASTYGAFLHRLEATLGVPRELAERDAQAVLCALEHRLFGADRSHFEAQLPLKVRSLVHSCERHDALGATKLDREGFLRMIAEHTGTGLVDAELSARAVFATVRMSISEGEVANLMACLPREIAAFWHRVG